MLYSAVSREQIPMIQSSHPIALGTPAMPMHVPCACDAVEASQMTVFARFCEGETWPSRFKTHTPSTTSASCTSAASGLCSSAGAGCSTKVRWSPSARPTFAKKAAFFPDLRLSYAENLLRIDGPFGGDRPAVTARDASGRHVRLTRSALRDRVIRFAGALDALGVTQEDRLVAVVHNDERAVIAALGTSAVGASLSTCSPDMGAFSILGRFSQLAPVVLIGHLSEISAGGSGELGERLREVVHGLPSLRAIVALDDGPIPTDLRIPVVRLTELEAVDRADERLFAWRRFLSTVRFTLSFPPARPAPRNASSTAPVGRCSSI